MAIIRQTNFTAGELAPNLWGRTELPMFGSGLRRARNFFVAKHGAAVSRPGTSLVAQAKPTTLGVRLVPFAYSDSESYALELGDRYIRFHTNGQQLQSSPGVAFEIGSPWVASELAGLQWAQTGDVVTFTHPDHPPMELRRYDTLDWELTALDFNRPDPDFRRPFIDLASIENQEDLDHPSRQWEWLVTGVARNERGRAYETKPMRITQAAVEYFAEWSPFINYTPGVMVSVTLPDGTKNNYVCNANPPQHDRSPTTWSGPGGEWVLDTTTPDIAPRKIFAKDIPALMVVYKDRPVTVQFAQNQGLRATDTGKVIAFRVYRGRGGVFGWVGDTTTGTFVDYGDPPDYNLPPPQGFNPFAVYADDGGEARDPDTGIITATPLRIENPRSVAFFQERRVFGGTNQRPGFVFFSTTGDYSNFDIRRVVVDNMALTFEMASRQREEARAMVGLDKLLVFTSSSVWAGGGASSWSGGSPLAPDSVDFRVQEEVGALALAPVVAGGVVFYVRAKGTGVRALVTDGTGKDARVGIDVSRQAEHLFQQGRVTEWAYAEDPWGLVWAVRDDGQLLSLTFSQADQLWGWCRHDTQGQVLSICSVPETLEDSIYLAVRRNGRILVERMTSRVNRGTAADAICTDSSTFHHPSLGNFGQTLTGIGHLAGMDVWALPFGVTADGTLGQLDPVGPLRVSSTGTVTLPFDPTAGDAFQEIEAFNVGLFSERELETLDAGGGAEKLRQKTVTAVGFEVDQSKGLWVGQDFDHLDEWRQREVVDGYRPFLPDTELVRTPVQGTWDLGARAALRQSLPLPVTVLGLIREVDLGG